MDNQKDLCSMLELSCLVSPTNVYVNIQVFILIIKEQLKPS